MRCFLSLCLFVLSVLPVMARADNKMTEPVDSAISKTADSYADKKPADDELVVYGLRLPTVWAETGSNVSVLTADMLMAGGKDFVIDALADLPGVSANRNGVYGGTGFIRLRGAPANGHALVIIDGVHVNDPASVDGSFDFATLNVQHIERIEVIRGAQSTLWGADAMSGVIVITTKRPHGRETTGFAEFGSFASVRGGVSLANASAKTNYRLSLSAHDTDGISKADAANGNSEKDGYENMTFTARGGLHADNNLRLDGSLYYTDTTSDYDGYAFAAQGNVVDGHYVLDAEQIIASVSARFASFGGRLENHILAGFAELSRKNSGQDNLFPAEYRGQRRQFYWQGQMHLPSVGRLLFGLEQDDIKTAATGTDIKQSGHSGFAVYEYKPMAKLTLTMGGRYDDYNRFAKRITTRLTAAWRPTPQTILRSSYGQGFKVPSPFQLSHICASCAAPNKNLQPERSKTADMSIAYRHADDLFSMQAGWFYQDIINLIDYNPSIGYANLASASAQGIELSADMRLNVHLSLSAGYTFTDAQTGNGRRLGRIPEHEGMMRFSYDSGARLTGHVMLRYNGREPDQNGGQIYVADWWRVDMYADYKLNDNMALYGRVENLLDADYQYVLGYGTPGRSAYLGMRLRY